MEQTQRLDNFDNAIVGIDFNNEPPILVYSKQAMIQVILDSGEMTLEEAIEYLEYNYFTAYIGDGGPMYIETGDPSEVLEMLEAYE